MSLNKIGKLTSAFNVYKNLPHALDNEPWFVGKDVAEALGYKNPSNAISVHVDKDDKTSYLIQVSGSNYKANTAIINESGLYSLILSSKLPTAKQFKHWVTAEVLPAIRKTGGYIAELLLLMENLGSWEKM